GVLHMALPHSVYPIAAGALWEAVYHPLAQTEQGGFCRTDAAALTALAEGKQAVLVGCGLSVTEDTRELLMSFLPTVIVPIVIDADGLNVLSGHIDVLKAMGDIEKVITPHPAEAARLLGVSVCEIERDRIGAVKRLATLCRAVVLLKGHRTLIASPDGTVYMNTTGCSGMATGGSGDVLGGMIASFAAQGMSAWQAAFCGAYIHGAAGETAAQRLSQTAMLPTDLIEALPTWLSHFEKRE
ncbi:MAG: NAD(P)H-hydrate dehydratase, partial [Clostridia bacterium]|nr:NAD(P)H-hydrate dehydratase [Clostridia bacterium]